MSLKLWEPTPTPKDFRILELLTAEPEAEPLERVVAEGLAALEALGHVELDESELFDVEELIPRVDFSFARAEEIRVDDSMVVACEPIAFVPVADSPWGPNGEAIERWFEAGEAGTWIDDIEDAEAWAILDTQRVKLFDAEDDIDGHVDTFWPRR